METDRPGFSAYDVHGKWSLRASVTSGLSLQDVRIPASNLLPGTGGLKSPLMCLNQARYGIGWGAIGAAMSCYDTALQYSLLRKQFRDQPIASHQLVQEKLAWMITEITKAQLLALQVGRLKDAGKVGHAAHLHGEAEQCMDGAGVRAHGARYPGRQWHYGRLSDHAAHDEPGIREDLRGDARYSHPGHRPKRYRHSGVLRSCHPERSEGPRGFTVPARSFTELTSPSKPKVLRFSDGNVKQQGKWSSTCAICMPLASHVLYCST